MNHGKETTLVSLLRDPACKEYDVLAIQEPWRNPFVTTGYNPPASDFYLTYPPFKLTRVCFYINKKLSPASWDVTHYYEDTQTLTLRYRENQEDLDIIQVHNIYNPSPESYSSKALGTIGTLCNALESSVTEANYVVVGDFNLYHPLWSSVERLTRH